MKVFILFLLLPFPRRKSFELPSCRFLCISPPPRSLSLAADLSSSSYDGSDYEDDDDASGGRLPATLLY